MLLFIHFNKLLVSSRLIKIELTKRKFSANLSKQCLNKRFKLEVRLGKEKKKNGIRYRKISGPIKKIILKKTVVLTKVLKFKAAERTFQRRF